MKTAFFPAKTLSHLPADNLEALAALCAEFERFDGHARQLPEHHDDYVEALSILKAFTVAREADLNGFPQMVPQRHQNIANIAGYFTQVRTAARTELTGRHSRGYFESKTEEYLSLFSRAQVYEFGEAEYKRVHELIGELQDLCRDSTLIGEEYKRRLLRRLEASRAELHRKTTEIDRFWSFLAEAGVTMRKYGEDLKPVADRVRELTKLVLGVVLAKEGIKGLPEMADLLCP